MDFLKQKLNLGAFGLVAVSMILSGTNAVSLKYASQTMDPLVFTGFRTLAIGLILLLFINNYKKITNTRYLVKLLPGAVLIIAFFALHAIGVSQSGALKASILSLTIPVFVYIFAIFLLHEPIIKRILLGGMLTLLGSVMLVGLPVLLG